VKGGQKSVNITPGQYYSLSNSMAKWSKPGVDGNNNFLQGCPKYTGRAAVSKLFSLQPMDCMKTIRYCEELPGGRRITNEGV
jgi:hypothetical protein